MTQAPARALEQVGDPTLMGVQHPGRVGENRSGGQCGESRRLAVEAGKHGPAGPAAQRLDEPIGVVQLRSGALPTKLTIVEERTVGPSLGADSIEVGKLAGFIGCLLTGLLTIIAYGTFGIFAVIGRPSTAHASSSDAIMSVVRHTSSSVTSPTIVPNSSTTRDMC